MAKLKALPSLEIIRGFKGTVDFFVQRGQVYARRWPRTPRSRLTQATLAAAALLGQISKAWSLVAPLALQYYIADAESQPRTPRDICISGILGHLHEASMSDFLDLLTQCRDLLQSINDLTNALSSSALDSLLVDVIAAILPPDAATLTEQQTQTVSLQLIDDLRAALRSVATDRILVRGADQLHSFGGVLAAFRTGVVSGAGGWMDGPVVPAATIWCVTNICALDATSATTRHDYLLNHDAAQYRFGESVAAFPAGGLSYWGGWKWLDPGDTIRVGFIGSLAGDTCTILLTGHIMTLEP